ncbi:hypothetical protein [Schumannella sp. 10F1B-5-1]|uniref:hypothetical protein n=1 Tax=Schumannella sp. 10F1B-5-1 TaxID=2590780 RepID=UPI001130836D|nr:hypothetical protein [Schumannella sp. 10F1B-5-1]TPW78402.1 hypothetical protein FJ658_00925 [Schumannella sp. 10F1B-5-1]
MAAADCGSNPLGCIAGGVGDAVNGAVGAVSYWSDPWGNTFKALKDASKSLSSELLPAVTKATLPDLSAEWFLNAYKISFAMAILAAVVLMIPQLYRTARGTQSGRDTLESLGLYFPLFLVGAIFGPAFGRVLVEFFHALSNSLASWGITSSVDKVTSQFSKMIDESDGAAIAGGLPLATVLMLCMLLGLICVLLVLIVQLVTLYFVGVLVPLSLVWILDPQRRGFGTKLLAVWVGILAAHPLLFFLLGVAFSLLASNIDVLGNSASLKKTVELVVAIIAMFMAAFSPLLLMKFAPLIPTGLGGASGPSISPGSWGAPSLSDAAARFGNRRTPDAPTPASSGGPADAAPVAARSSAGGLGEAAAARAGASSAAAGASSAAGATTAAESVAAAGAAESATGAGAVIGVPTLIAAGVVAGGAKVAEVTEAAGQQATAAMDDGEGE